MKKLTLTALVTIVSVYGCSTIPPETQAVQDAAAAMGGVDTIMGVTTGTMEGSGRNYRLGQNVTPDGPLPDVAVESYIAQADLANHRLHLEIASANFLGIINTAVQGLDGGLAYNVGGNGNIQRLGGLAERDRLAQYYHHPLMLLQAAFSEDAAMVATVSNYREEMAQTVVDVTTNDGVQLSLHIDLSTGLPSKITSRSSNGNLGDVTLTSAFSDWADAGGGLMLPGTINRMVDELPSQELTVSYTVNSDVGDLSAPAEVAVTEPAGPPIANVVADLLADGVWHLTGQSHHSALVQFSDFGVLVEAPQNDTRALAVIDQARELLGDIELRYLVNTHHHFDHSGGLRAAVAEGLTVVTHESNAELFQQLVERPHTIDPDHLTENFQPLMLETVSGDEVYEITSGDRTLQVFRVTGDPHNAGMLAMYLPDERILIEADDYTPGRGGPSAAALLQNVRDRELNPQRIAPIHGPVVPFSDLEAQVAADAAN
jgi:glyoxylase-like metal-dependent hydrolase (beta-lactamase superfamily II)